MAKEKGKKSVFKRWWFWVIVVIIVIAVAVNGGEDDQKTNTNSDTISSTKKSDTSSDKKTNEKKTESKAGILDGEKFNKIKNGMTYQEVVNIIGSEGKVLSESGEKGTEFHTVIYTWEADGDLGANANFTFQGGKLINKAQMGVVQSSDVTVTLDEFNQIQNGMSYDKVVSIIGGQGNMISETGEKGTDLYTVMYEYKGDGDLGANANFMFQGGKLQNKAQFGLK